MQRFCGMSEVSEAGGLRALRCSENRLRAFGPGDFLRTSAPSALQLRSLRSFRKKLQNISQKEQNITKNEFIIQRKHRYRYNIPFKLYVLKTSKIQIFGPETRKVVYYKDNGVSVG